MRTMRLLREFIFLVDSVFITESIRKKLPEGEINGMLYRHSKHDWGDVGEESWAMNDEAANAKQGSILSSYAFTDGSSFSIEYQLADKKIESIEGSIKEM